MNPLLWIKLGIFAAIIGGAFYAGDFYKQAEWDAAKVKQAALDEQEQAQHLAQIQQHVDNLHKAEAQHEIDQNIIDSLGDQLRGVRVEFPACRNTLFATGAGAAGGSAASGVFSGGIDAAFATFQDGLVELARRCDALNADAIQHNTENK